jgi:outer membrane biosynthesis protein TonB
MSSTRQIVYVAIVVAAFVSLFAAGGYVYYDQSRTISNLIKHLERKQNNSTPVVPVKPPDAVAPAPTTLPEQDGAVQPKWEAKPNATPPKKWKPAKKQDAKQSKRIKPTKKVSPKHRERVKPKSKPRKKHRGHRRYYEKCRCPNTATNDNIENNPYFNN